MVPDHAGDSGDASRSSVDSECVQASHPLSHHVPPISTPGFAHFGRTIRSQVAFLKLPIGRVDDTQEVKNGVWPYEEPLVESLDHAMDGGADR